MYQLDDLLLFVAVAENRSFLRTSIIVNTTQQTVSRKIKQLSEEFGCELFISDGRHLKLTDFGELLYDLVKVKSMHLEELRSSVGELVNGTKQNAGKLKIRLPNGVFEEYFTELMGDFISLYPNINVHIIYDFQAIDFENESQYDLVITTFIPKKQNYKITKILELDIGLYCTKGYVNKYGLPNTPLDLHNHRYLNLYNNGDIVKKVEFVHITNKTVESIELSDKILINNISRALSLIRSNSIIVPYYNVMIPINDDLIVKVLPEYKLNFARSYYIIRNPYKDNAIVNLFMSFFKKRVQETFNHIVNP